MSIPARKPSFVPAVALSVLAHAALLPLLPALMDAGDEDPWGAPEVQVGEKRPEEVVRVVEDDAPDIAPVMPVPVKAPEEETRMAEAPAPVPEPPMPKPKREARKKLHNPGALMIDQPEVDDESEPPPDTKVLGPQDRKVDVETQPMRRSLKARQDAKRRRSKDDAEDKRPATDDTTQAPRKADVRGKKEAKKAEKSDRERTQKPGPKPSRARKAQRKGKVGSPQPEGAATPEVDGVTGEAAGEAGAQNPEPGEAGGGAKVDVEAALRVDAGMYEEMFGARDAKDKKRLDGRERRLLGRWRKRAEATRAALENYVPNVRYGNHIAINSRKSVYAAWVARVHRSVHRLWGVAYLRHLDLNFPYGHPLSNPRLKATIEFVVSGETGEIVESAVVSSSGVLEYDAEAIRVVHAVAPTQPPPRAIHSPDGNVYVHWSFWRDTRQCGTFGVSIYKLNADGRVDEYEVTRPVDDLGSGKPPHEHRHRKKPNRHDLTGDGPSPDTDRP